MQELAAIILRRAQTQLDKIKTYEVEIQACMSQTQMHSALQLAVESLALLGVPLPEQPDYSHVQHALAETQALLQGRDIQTLAHLPLMTDATSLAAMRILSSASSAAFTSNPFMFSLIVLKQVQLSIEYGNSELSPFGYVCYAILLCGVVFEIESGYQFGQLALTLIELHHATKIQTKTLNGVYGMVWVWKHHIRDTLKPLQSQIFTALF